METDALESYLARHPLLRNLDPGYPKLIAACACHVHFDAGERISRQGDAADRCLLLREGCASLEIPSPHAGVVRIQTLGAGEVLGCSWLFPPYKWHFDARAVEPTDTVGLDGQCLRDKFDQHPILGYALMKRFSSILFERMQAARLQVMDLYGPTSG